MAKFKSMEHPGWVGVVFPLALAVASTFSPDKVRGFLLVAAFVAATWTFHNTELAGRNLKGTAIGALVFFAVAAGVFVMGHILDARKITQPDSKVVIERPLNPMPVPIVPADVLTDNPKKPSPKPKPNGNTRKETVQPGGIGPNGTAAPSALVAAGNGTSTGPVTVQPGAVASFGQQGGITAGTVNIGPVAKPLILSKDQQESVRLSMEQFAETRVTIMVNQPTDETIAFGKNLKATMEDSHWHVELNTAQLYFPDAGCQSHPGVSFAFGSNRLQQATSLGKALGASHVIDGKVPACELRSDADTFEIVISPTK